MFIFLYFSSIAQGTSSDVATLSERDTQISSTDVVDGDDRRDAVRVFWKVGAPHHTEKCIHILLNLDAMVLLCLLMSL